MALLAERIALARGWRCSPKAAHVRVCQMLAGERSLPADCVPLVIETTRRTGVLAPISAAVIRMQAECEELERPGVRAVRRERRRDTGTG